ncbi:MAG: crotonase/enoyl-CoA hydratase family protein [Hyphomicrobiaceae bacterium]|nr:crotonase/enoyl-CoA hydratase family protein [Hyphomicrobiaceae bacterium]
MTSDLDVSTADGLQTIRFTRPGKKNSLTRAMYAEMTAALSRGDADPGVVAHLFIGSGGVFSAGNDIGEFLEAARGGIGIAGPVLDFIRLLPRVEKPLIAAVEGLAIGIATTMLLHFDLVYATRDAGFSTPFLDLGLLPEAGSSLLAPLRMGHARAFELLVLGEPFTAERAREAGLVNAIEPASELEATARKAAARLAAKPPQALAMARRMLRGDVAAIAERIEDEARAFESRVSSPEAREAFSAFLEKRPPDFGKLGRG